MLSRSLMMGVDSHDVGVPFTYFYYVLVPVSCQKALYH